jgi:hypothetical protein
MYGRRRCTDCDFDFFEGVGKCRACHGTGENVHLNSDSPICENCKGSGICPSCGGSGYFGGSGSFDGGIQTLFGPTPE